MWKLMCELDLVKLFEKNKDLGKIFKDEVLAHRKKYFNGGNGGT